MRVIAGKFKGKVLSEFELSSTRPTTDLVREALFDKIGLMVANSICLDLFAGTGALGIEALSRNAKFCYFVDKERNAIKIINKNLSLVKAENCEVLNFDFDKALNHFEKENLKFDFVFLDPPYASDFAEQAIVMLTQKHLLNDESLVVWEHDKTKLQYIEQNFESAKTKKYGQKFITYIYT